MMLMKKIKSVFNSVARELVQNLPHDVLVTGAASGIAAVMGFAPPGAVALGWAAGAATIRILEGVLTGVSSAPRYGR